MNIQNHNLNSFDKPEFWVKALPETPYAGLLPKDGELPFTTPSSVIAQASAASKIAVAVIPSESTTTEESESSSSFSNATSTEDPSTVKPAVIVADDKDTGKGESAPSSVTESSDTSNSTPAEKTSSKLLKYAKIAGYIALFGATIAVFRYNPELSLEGNYSAASDSLTAFSQGFGSQISAAANSTSETFAYCMYGIFSGLGAYVNKLQNITQATADYIKSVPSSYSPTPTPPAPMQPSPTANPTYFS